MASSTDWQFKCLDCGHVASSAKPVMKCPGCGKSGWNLVNTGPIVESDVPQWPMSRKVVFSFATVAPRKVTL